MKIIKAEVQQHDHNEFEGRVTVQCDGVIYGGIECADDPQRALRYAFDTAVKQMADPIRDSIKVNLSVSF